MATLTEQVREGLTAKIQSIEAALNVVKDPRELDRLNKDLEGARAALAKLDEPDSRSEEELNEISKMIEDKVDVNAPTQSWDSMKPIEKFAYHIGLYLDKLRSNEQEAESQSITLHKVFKFMARHKADNEVFMQPVLKQFGTSLAEIDFSIQCIGEQLALTDDVLELIEDEDFFDKLVLLNRFLNNPMNLPHLTEEHNKKLEDFRVSLK